MENEIYRKIITPASQTDAVTPTAVVVTQEVNCWIVWLEGIDFSGHVLYLSRSDRDAAIEKAVELGKLPETQLAEMLHYVERWL